MPKLVVIVIKVVQANDVGIDAGDCDCCGGDGGGDGNCILLSEEKKGLTQSEPQGQKKTSRWFLLIVSPPTYVRFVDSSSGSCDWCSSSQS